MEQINIQYLKTPYGELILGSYDQQLCLCDWRYRKMRRTIDKRITKGINGSYVEGTDEVLEETTRQLNEYFNHQRKIFELPLNPIGTDFQKRVWNELINVPFGQTASYLELAEKLSDKSAVRAVASANGANAISIIIPCHRIIGSSGKLVGYAGGLSVKAKLLALESDLFNQ